MVVQVNVKLDEKF